MNQTKNDELIKARTRQANADAALKELRYKEKSGELVKRVEIEKEVQAAWIDAVMKVRTKIIGVEALAPHLAGMTVQEAAAELRRWSRDVLNELSTEFK